VGVPSAGDRTPTESSAPPAEARPHHATRPTLAELALAAGVNKSTVSRALRDDHTIGPETRHRIQQMAAEMHYEPNASARRLFHARTDVLAFTAHALSRAGENPDPFLVELLSMIMAEAGERKLDVLLCRSEPGANELDPIRRITGGAHADGFILMDLRPNDPRLPYLSGKHFPHVLFGRPAEDIEEARRYPYPWVEVDNRAGARAGTEHLIALGHTRVAFVGCDDTYIYERDRLAGYRDALAAAGIASDATLCTEGGLTQEDGYWLTRRLLAQEEPPTAVFAASDVLAVGAMRAAQEAGLRVGRAFPIMGFDGLGLGTYVTPPLTTLRQPMRTVGRLLVRLLAAELDGTAAAHGQERHEIHHLVQPELVVRASTAGEEAAHSEERQGSLGT
jgi:DNA-binding LacI/PurR family transcriptional regulator